MRFYRRKKDISIHAPTRGATPHRGGLEEAMRISIHAPTRGATYTHAPPLTKTSISIHAPTRGATVELRKPRRSRHNFNPRSHKGSDGVFCWLHEQQGKISIHAPTRGATILRHELIHAFLYISIHAPTRGATLATGYCHTRVCNFNPRSHKGSDISRPESTSCRKNFNPRSHKGSDDSRAE